MCANLLAVQQHASWPALASLIPVHELQQVKVTTLKRHLQLVPGCQQRQAQARTLFSSPVCALRPSKGASSSTVRRCLL